MGSGKFHFACTGKVSRNGVNLVGVKDSGFGNPHKVRGQEFFEFVELVSYFEFILGSMGPYTA